MRSAPKSSPSRWARSMRWAPATARVTTRWIYTDGTPHSPKEKEFGKWHGESIGFWNGDELDRAHQPDSGWKGGLSESSDGLETVERYRRVGDRIEGEITLYDPEVYVSPINGRLNFRLDKETPYEDRMQFNTCTDTHGTVTERLHGRKGSAEYQAGWRSALLGSRGHAPLGDVPERKRQEVQAVRPDSNAAPVEIPRSRS